MNLIIENFRDRYADRGIHLDDFQLEAIEALAQGRDVLVSAPTGAGKTIVAEFAVELALATSTRCVYTAPIKALSNQKYKDLAAKHGEENVGLLTGDQTINREAPVVVVTTEVLRNMLFQRDEGIADVGYAVLDEVHYLADQFRGPVWEEVILQLPAHVRLVSLSATVSNIEEFSGWLRSVRGRTETVVSTVRPVPLSQHVAVARRIVPLYGPDGDVSPQLARADRNAPESRGRRRGTPPARRRKLLEQLQEQDLLPAIEFIFSRKGCDRAVGDLLDSDIFLTTRDEEREISKRLKLLRGELSDADARAIRFNFWAKAFSRGFAAHHAGMFPALKELAEKLMEDGLLKLVYATGTLALGIDMPVRTVVLEELHRWNGADFVNLTATEYTQLIGRAGRRGKDKFGNAVVLHTDDLDIQALADLGSGRVEPLQSAFFPSYNTVINLLAYYSYEDARAIMGTSFAQYQNNADLGQVEARIVRVRNRIGELTQELEGTCERGDVVEYIRMRERAGRASKSERKRAKAAYRERMEDSWNAVETGRLYAYAREGELEYGVVLSRGKDKARLVNIFAEMVWLRESELSAEMRDLGRIEMPFGMSPKDPAVREDIAEAIIAAVDDRTELGTDRDLEGSWDRFAVKTDPELESHPVHTCPDLRDHIEDATELMSLDSRLEELRGMREDFDESVAREFDATANVLKYLGFIQPGEDGHVRLAGGANILRGIHNEADLLICLSLNESQLEELSAEEFAGLCSAFLCDRRLGGDLPRDPRLRAAWSAIERNLVYLLELESQAGIMRTAEPFPGAAEAFTEWARGADLEAVMHMSNLVVGDFISANRRLIDLLGQLIDVGNGTWIEAKAREARDLIRRWEWL